MAAVPVTTLRNERAPIRVYESVIRMYYLLMTATSTRADELTAAMIGIVADEGLEALSVRTVADRCAVSIGTVQYHFPSKEAMLVGAFQQVVTRIGDRIAAHPPGPDPRRTLAGVLLEIVPLDDERLAEARVVTAFSAAAATKPALASVQTATLERVVSGVARCVARARATDPGESSSGSELLDATDLRTARLAVAAADGLALHAVSAPGTLGPDELEASVQELVAALLGRNG